MRDCQILRKFVEMENSDFTTPAAEWEYDDWKKWREPIVSMQNRLVMLGAVPMICRLLGTCHDTDLIREGVLVCVALLIGGNPAVQVRSMFSLLASALTRSEQKKFYAFFRGDANTHLMFGELHDRISKAMAAAKKRKKEMKGGAGESVVLHDDDADASERYLTTIIFRFLQLLCEGHNLKLQRFLSQQAGAAKSYDLVSESVLYVSRVV